MDMDVGIEDTRFQVEDMIDYQWGMGMMPFATLDKSKRIVCKQFALHGTCDKGRFCFFRHPNPSGQIVCKHWLRGLCKKNDDCEFLHELDAERMPDCFFFLKYGKCANKECPFKHHEATGSKQNTAASPLSHDNTELTNFQPIFASRRLGRHPHSDPLVTTQSRLL